MKDLKKMLILAGCVVLVLTLSLVGCLGGGNSDMDCNCGEDCTPECTCGCEAAAQTVFANDRNRISVAVIGSNSALANIGIDMTKEFLETVGKTAEFNEIHDRDVLRALKSGNVDVAISFQSRTNDRELMWLPIVSRDSERFYIAVRRNDTEFMDGFQRFINQYHQNGNLERLARQHMANYRDFLDDIRPPFRFRR